MNDLRLLPDEALDDDEFTSKWVGVEEDRSTGGASSSVSGWEWASSCGRVGR